MADLHQDINTVSSLHLAGGASMEQFLQGNIHLDAFFRQIKLFRRFRLAFSFGLQTYYLIDFSKVYRLKGLKPKNKG